MCTIVVGHRLWDATPLLVAANRDEKVERPSRPPEVWSTGIMAPVDERAGGTWLGHNAAGVIAAVTNRFGAPLDPSRRSRGELVPRALTRSTAQEAADLFRGDEGNAFNPFNLLIADAETAWLARPSEAGVTVTQLSPGLHVITERSDLAVKSPRESSVEASLASWSTTEPPSEAEIRALLGLHRQSSFDGHCVHLPDLGYATRSSSILRLSYDGAVSWRFADGPPRSAPFYTID
jgi:uncharacterized protein with NRDE domain